MSHASPLAAPASLLALQRPFKWGPAGVSSPEAAFSLPVGTVTFVLTDVEGSTRLWSTGDPAVVRSAVARHYALIADAIARHGGVRPQEQGEGDSVVAAFARPSEALTAVLEAQRALHIENWPTETPIRVRMAVHTGEAQLRDGSNYAGQAIIRTARLRALGHGGQVLVSAATRDLAVDQTGEHFAFRPLGEHQLRDLARPERVFQLLDPDLPAEFPPLRTSAPKHNLPIILSPFIGRASEIADLFDAVQSERLVTVVGAGGAGKTRLAHQTAAAMLDGFDGGVVWVEFAAVAPSGAVDAVRQAFGFPDRAAGQLATDVARFVDGRSALLVLDNCEHLVDEAAEICAELLAAAPTLRILATSRRSLDLPGERTWRIPPLSMPPADRTEPLEALSQYDAVTLFADRAVRSRPNFRLNADNAPAVAEIVHRLDGMPLALELAAARVRTLSPQQILNGLGDAFRLLTGGSRVLLPRQQTLETSILWSYELLDPTEQRLLRHLSAFAGSSTLDAIEAVCADGDLDVSKVLDTLDRLVDHSLVQVVDGDQHRYLLLETVRQFAARVTTSEERNALAARHATHFTAVAHDIGQLASTPALLDHVDRCLLDEPDLLKAFDWLVEHHQAQSAAAMVVALEGLLAIAGRPLTVRRMVARAATLDLAADVRAHLTFLDATAAVTAADFATAIARLDEVDTMTAESGDELNAARTDGFRRILLVGMNSEHADTLDEPIARLRAAGDHRLADRLTAGIVSLAAGRGRGEREIRARLAEAESGVAFDDPRASEMVRIAHIALAVLSCDITDVADQALAVLDRRHSFPNASACGMHLAMCLPLLPPTTADRAVALLEARARLGDQWASISLDAALSAQYVLADRHDLAWDAYSRHLGHVFVGRGSSCDAGLVAIASSGVPMHPIGNFDPTASGWGAEAARLTGDLGNAADRCHTLLATAATSDDRMTALITLDTLVAVEADAGRHRDAARLLGTVDAVMSHHRMTRPPALQRRRDRALTGMIEAEGAESVERLLLEGGSLELWAAVEYARRRRSSHTTATVGWAALTPAEAKVAALVAEGRTNPDVATALLMSHATVKTHLSRIFTKLGVSNRQELMLAAVRRRPRSPGPTSEAGGDVTQGT